MGDIIGADPGRLIVGGVDLTELRRLINQLAEEIDDELAPWRYDAGASDHLAEIFREMYAERFHPYASSFMHHLAGVLNNYGQQTIDAGKVSGQTNIDATQIAAGGRRG